VKVNAEKYGIPVIELGRDDKINISFDQLSHEAHNYGYAVVHCNADFSESSISTTEFLQGYTTADITDVSLSQTTTVLYTHYRFSLPNEDMNLTLAGNYAAIIYEDNNRNKPVAVACFSIVEPKVDIQAKVRGNTDTELNASKQQLDFEISPKGYTIRDVNSELKVVVRQNNRYDNEIVNLAPTYFSVNNYKYINNKNLIFEGGNEYHRFDISSVYTAATGVDYVRYQDQNYEVFLYPNRINRAAVYSHDFDVNGRYVINHQEAMDDPNTEGDYLQVHFRLDVDYPFADGKVFIGGDWNYNLLDEAAEMQYNSALKAYTKTLLLKQGGYNYQYWLLGNRQRKATTAAIDGSYWQTRNEYTIYVYHRPWGGRYDKLVGIKTIE
ncbi:MAG: DUF5103 domain-containing protein, partial [Paludibacter sp.]|nr:DUF5103 domain-containing protein [Paludibacter sp.]